MPMSVGVEYAFHSLFYMVDIPAGKTVGIRELAELNALSEAYLSKVFTKLRKAGIVRSIPGVNGGYELARRPESVTFWDVVEAIEGASYAFQCAEIRQKNILADPGAVYTRECPCLIKVVMQEAEEKMRGFLREKTLAWLYSEVNKGFSGDKKAALKNWIQTAANR
jgi:Rrf2 family protein